MQIIVYTERDANDILPARAVILIGVGVLKEIHDVRRSEETSVLVRRNVESSARI